MSKNVEIVLNSAGVRELLKSNEVANTCREHAERILGNAGKGYEMEQRNYPERTGFSVYAATPRAMTDNKKNNTLLKAVRT